MPSFTKQAIKMSFMKLLNEQPLNKISVRSIVEDCGINRNSFYYHFQDIPALMEEIIVELADGLVKKYPKIESLEDCVSEAFDFALKNKKAVLHIFNSMNRDLFERYLMHSCEYVVRTYLNTVFGESLVSEEDREIAIRFFRFELFGAGLDWLSCGMPKDRIEEIHHVITLCHCLSDEMIRRCNQTEI